MIKHKMAFTLAEILIVMAVIGGIAAITVPGVVSGYQEKKRISSLRSVYTDLQASFAEANVKYGNVSTWPKGANNSATSELRAKRLVSLMKIKHDCGMSVGTNGGFRCFPRGSLTGATATSCGCALSTCCENEENNIGSSSGYYKILLDNGTSLAITFIGDNAEVRVAVDGPSGEYETGKTVFGFELNGLTVKPKGIGFDRSYDGNDTLIGEDIYTTNWVIINGNMEHLKLNQAHQCPDGTTLNWRTKLTCN